MSEGGDAPSSEELCPRCGGAPAAKRAPTAKNPFLPKSKKLVCSLCGLDYEKGAKPWATGRPPPPDGQKAT